MSPNLEIIKISLFSQIMINLGKVQNIGINKYLEFVNFRKLCGYTQGKPENSKLNKSSKLSQMVKYELNVSLKYHFQEN